MDAFLAIFWLLSPMFVIAATIGAFFGVYRFAKRYPPANISDHEPTGVGGWLLLLVTGLMVLGPLIGAAKLGFSLMSAESQSPQIISVPAWSTYKSTVLWTFVIVSAVSFYAGLGLAKERNFSVVNQTKVLLWIIGPVAFIVMQLLIPLAIFGKANFDQHVLGAFILSLIAPTIWTAYLYKSRRVFLTYTHTQSENHA